LVDVCIGVVDIVRAKMRKKQGQEGASRKQMVVPGKNKENLIRKFDSFSKIGDTFSNGIPVGDS